MVDALRRAHQWLTPDGVVVDVHPTAEPATTVDIDGEAIGPVQAGDAPLRHAAADAAVRTVVGDRLFAADPVVEFDFFTYGDTIDELRDHIVENWRSGQISEDVMHRSRDALARARSSVKPRVLERVRLTTLRPLRTNPRVS
jgi:hypothetical protein